MRRADPQAFACPLAIRAFYAAIQGVSLARLVLVLYLSVLKPEPSKARARGGIRDLGSHVLEPLVKTKNHICGVNFPFSVKQ